jgi:hypothetical protein
MPTIYEAGFQSAAAVQGAPYCELLAGANQAKLREIHITLDAATSAAVQVARTTASGTSAAPIAPDQRDPEDRAAAARVNTAWTLVPVIGAPILRRYRFAAVLGAGATLVIPIDSPIIIPTAKSIVLWNPGAGAGPVLNVTLVWEE